MTATDTRFARLATELDVTVRRLQWMQAELGELAREQRAVPAPPPLQPPPLMQPPAPFRPAWQAPSAPGSAPSAPRPAPSKPPVFTVGRVLAGAGVLVTLVGVALLLVLAAQAGLLGPPVRVGLGVALAAGLVGAGVWLRRRPGGAVGATALAATGVAAAYLDTVAVTGVYHWVHPAVGLALSGLIALAGLWLASRWNSQWLGIAVFAPVYVLAPPLADSGYLLGGFTVILAVASVGVRRPADWQWLHVVRAVGTSGTLAVLALAANSHEALPALGAAVLGAAIGLLAAADPIARAGRARPLVGAGIVTVLPVLLALPGAPAWASAGAGAAIVAATVALGLLPGTTSAVRAAWYATSAVTALVAVTELVPERWVPATLLGLAAAALLAAGRDRAATWSAAALGAVGALWALALFGETVLSMAPRGEVPHAGSAAVLVASAAGLAVALLFVWRAAPLVSVDVRVAVGIGGGVLALGAVTFLLVNAGWAIGGVDGMRWGHGLATVTWMTVGAAAVLVRRPSAGTPAVIAGLTMIGAAVAKLFLFDLASLDGAVRVVAFLVVGVALLGVGAAYAARSSSSG